MTESWVSVGAAAFDAAALAGPLTIHGRVTEEARERELSALHRDLHELECLAVDERRDGFIEWAVHHECDAAVVEARIAALEAKEQVAA